MTIQQLIQNHHNVIGYVAGLAKALTRVSSTPLDTEQLGGELPDGVDPAAVVAEVQAQMAQMAKVLNAAAEVLAHQGVMSIAVLEAVTAGNGEASPDPEALLTTRKRAQA
jgi:hypothetical protein